MTAAVHPVLSDLRAWLAGYRRRERCFGRLPEAQWRILLTIAVEGPCRITSATAAAGVPQTTGLRHVDALIGRGLIVRTDDPHDGRAAFLALTETARGLFKVFAA